MLHLAENNLFLRPAVFDDAVEPGMLLIGTSAA